MTRFIDDLTDTSPSPKEVERILDRARTLRSRAFHQAAADIWTMLGRVTAPAPKPRPGVSDRRARA